MFYSAAFIILTSWLSGKRHFRRICLIILNIISIPVLIFRLHPGMIYAILSPIFNGEGQRTWIRFSMF